MKALKCLTIAVYVWMNLSACSTVGVTSHPMHSFGFDTRHDSPDVEVMDYHYGNDKQRGVRPESERVAMGQSFPYERIYGELPRADFLYVKWRIKDRMRPDQYLGSYQDRVDLRTRLPVDIDGFGIHFVVKGRQLYVYLIPPPGVWPAGAMRPSAPSSMSEFLKQHQIYPDQPK